MSKDLVLEFLPDGRVTIDAVGFKGKGCREASADYEAALGTTDVQRTTKPEAHQTETTARPAVRQGR
jgi:hypothetical protein